MSFPPAFLDELRARLPLSEIVGKRIRLARAGREYKGCCPFHNEKTPSFYVNDDKQFYHCFGCAAHGDVIGFVMHHDRLAFPEAVEILAARAGLQVPKNTSLDRQKFDTESRLYALLDRANSWFEEQLFLPQGRDALAYLKKRGLSEDAIRRFRLGFAPNDGQAIVKALLSAKPASKESGGITFKIDDLITVGLVRKSEERADIFGFFRNRVIFPVSDRRGRTVAFGARIMGDGEPKYLNSPDHPLFHKGKLLYGLARARTAVTEKQPIIVVEGYMDVIALVEAGYKGAVAPLGTALTEHQLAAIWKLLPPPDTRDPAVDYSPILCFDGDAAGQRAASRAIERALPLLTPNQTVRVAYLPSGEDPDDLLRRGGKTAMQTVLDAAKPMVEAIWDMTLSNRRMQTPEERGAFMTALRHQVGRIGDEDLRRLYQADIREKLSAAFAFKSNDNNPAPRTKGPWKPRAPLPAAVNRRSPQGPHRARERVLLALMINYPDLFIDFGEDLVRIGFTSPEFEALRQRLIGILSHESLETLDATELYRHLSTEDAASVSSRPSMGSLTEVLSETTYMHAGFARPGRSLEQARNGWKSIWNKYLQEQLHVDLQTARRHYGENASDENLTRLLALRDQVEALIRESGEATASEQASSVSQEN